MLNRGLLTLLFCGLLASPAWAFPDNGVLENFTGADTTSPPNSNWTNAPLTTGGTTHGVRITGNRATTATNSEAGEAYWDTTEFGPNQEAFATLSVVGNPSPISCVHVRVRQMGANTSDGYSVCARNSDSTVKTYRNTNSVGTEIGSTAQTVANGDQLGVTAIGSEICPWFNDGGAGWVKLTCTTDATYSGGGFIGITVFGSTSTGQLDDFGGGNLAVSRRPIPPILFQ